jgi:kynureninase
MPFDRFGSTSRSRFHFPVGPGGDPDCYLLGNSLGLQPRTAEGYVLSELRKWQTLASAAHFQGDDPWMPYHELLAEPLAEIVGSRPDEVVAMNSLTVNLHLMMATFYQPIGRRCKILMEANPFPSDFQAITTGLQCRGQEPEASLCIVPADPRTGQLSSVRLCEAIEMHRDELALIILPGVHFLTGEFLDLKELTAVAHQFEIPIGWDLAHAVGNVPLELHTWDVDFAVWCSYKYLNAGPGAIGGAFIHQRHGSNKLLPRLGGWWGHDKWTRFQMQPVFDPIPTAEGWQLSNPPILAMAPLRASLAEFQRAGGMSALRGRSLALVAFLEQLIETQLSGFIEIITPSDPHLRGSQLSLRLCRPKLDKGPLCDSKEVVQRLETVGVIADHRLPDVIRVALAPLYNIDTDAIRFVDALSRILKSST